LWRSSREKTLVHMAVARCGWVMASTFYIKPRTNVDPYTSEDENGSQDWTLDPVARLGPPLDGR
jgi:hypothetical protein